MEEAWTTAVIEFDETQEIEAFPNPFGDKITVKFDLLTTQYLNISLFNGVGQLVQSLWNGNVSSTSESMQFSNLNTISSGVYFLRITNEQGVKQTILVKK